MSAGTCPSVSCWEHHEPALVHTPMAALPAFTALWWNAKPSSTGNHGITAPPLMCWARARAGRAAAPSCRCSIGCAPRSHGPSTRAREAPREGLHGPAWTVLRRGVLPRSTPASAPRPSAVPGVLVELSVVDASRTPPHAVHGAVPTWPGRGDPSGMFDRAALRPHADERGQHVVRVRFDALGDELADVFGGELAALAGELGEDRFHVVAVGDPVRCRRGGEVRFDPV